MIKLIATDMDGTLINDEGKINEKIFDLISNLHERGIQFAAASGRFYSQLSYNFKKVNKDIIFIAHNGALVKYNNEGPILYSSCISREDINSTIDLNIGDDAELFIAGADHPYIINPTEHMLNTFTRFDVKAIIVNSFDEVTAPIYKITYHVANGVKPAMLEYLKNNLSENLEFVASGSNWIDIMNKGTSKGHAIKMLQKKFSIDKKNTMVFGDYYNDLTMFKSAHYSYAMKNAPEDVKKHANFVAESNNDNGVYNVISKYTASI